MPNRARKNKAAASSIEALDGIAGAVQRFTSILPEVAPDAESKVLVASHGSRLNRHLRLVLDDAQHGQVPVEINPILSQSAKRISSLVDTLETQSLVGIATIEPINEVYVFNRLREWPQERVTHLINQLTVEPASLTPLEQVGLHYTLVDLGVGLGLGIGVVGWIKLILVVLLVLLLIVSLFKPELLPAITALAGVLAAIDAAGGGKSATGGGGGGDGGGSGGGQPSTAQQLALIKEKNAALKEMIQNLKDLKDAAAGTTAMSGAINSLQQAIADMSEKIADETKQVDGGGAPRPGIMKVYHLEHCDWTPIYPYADGKDHKWQINFVATGGATGAAELQIEVDGQRQPPMKVGDPPRMVTGKLCKVHLNGQRGDKGMIEVTTYY